MYRAEGEMEKFVTGMKRKAKESDVNQHKHNKTRKYDEAYIAGTWRPYTPVMPISHWTFFIENSMSIAIRPVVL